MDKSGFAVLLMVGLVVVPSARSWAGPDDEKVTAAEKVLKDKGLTRNDRRFLLDGEAAAIEQYQKTKSVHADFLAAQSKYAAILQYDEAVQTMEAERTGLQQEINALQTQINNTSSRYSGRMRGMLNTAVAPLRQQETQDRAMINQINSQLQASKSQAPKAEDRKTVPAEFEKQKTAYIDSVKELDALVAPLLKQYHELALDKDVTAAVADLKHSTKLNIKLGPTDQILAASRLIQDVKKATGVPTSSKSSSKKKAKAK